VPSFDQIKIERVIGSQTFILQHLNQAVSIHTPLLPGSNINHSATSIEIHVAYCELQTTANCFSVNLKLLINEKIIISQPDSNEIKLEFSFYKFLENLTFTNCLPNEIPPELLKNLKCEVFDAWCEEEIELNHSTNTFNEILKITLLIKIIFTDQISLNNLTPNPLIPDSVLTGMFLITGSIIQNISKQTLKTQLLQKNEKLINLLTSGRFYDALLILISITHELQFAYNAIPSERIALNLVLRNLKNIETELLAQL